MIEHFFQCPYCWENISALIDTSVAVQSYVEDCEVCCNPIEFSIRCERATLLEFEVQPLGQ